MKPDDFKLERFFARYEFDCPHLLCCSDCESISIQDLLAMQPGAQDEFFNLWLGYTEPQGNPALCQEIASLYENIIPRQVLVHCGAQEAIHNMAVSILKPDDNVIVQTPCYQSLTELPRSCGCSVKPWPLRPSQNGWHADLDELKTLIGSSTRLLIVNTPHNPTGHLFSPDEWQQLIDLLRQRGVILFADEVYRYLEHEQQPLPWACDCYENAISLGVMSKSFGLAGLRIGWIATQNIDHFRAMASFKDYTTICNSAPSEMLAYLALRHRDSILTRNLSLIKNNLRCLEQFFSQQQDRFCWLPPKGGSIAFPAFRGPLSATRYAEELAQQEGILLLPGSCYDYDDRHFRIGYGRANFPEVLTKWGNSLGVDMNELGM